MAALHVIVAPTGWRSASPFAEAPAIDLLNVETPVTADTEARQFPAFQKLVDGAWMDT